MANSYSAPGASRTENQSVTGKIKEQAEAAGEQARTAASRVTDQARNVASTVADKADDALSRVGQEMSSLAGSIREKAPQEGVLGKAASTVADNLRAGGDYLQQHGLNDMGEDVTRLIRRHPLPSLLMAFGVGAMIGMSWSRR